MINNAAPKNKMGAANGTAQTFEAFCRGIGPIIAGGLYSWSLSNALPYPFDFHFVGNFMALLALVAFCISFVPNKEEKK